MRIYFTNIERRQERYVKKLQINESYHLIDKKGHLHTLKLIENPFQKGKLVFVNTNDEYLQDGLFPVTNYDYIEDMRG